MAALKKPHLERFAQIVADLIAQGLKKGAAADLASAALNLSKGTKGSNSRRRVNYATVDKRISELLGPAFRKAAEAVEASAERTERKLAEIAYAPTEHDSIRPSDQISAARALMEMNGWKAPEKRDVTVRNADQMSDDELADIAAGGGTRNPATPISS